MYFTVLVTYVLYDLYIDTFHMYCVDVTLLEYYYNLDTYKIALCRVVWDLLGSILDASARNWISNFLQCKCILLNLSFQVVKPCAKFLEAFSPNRWTHNVTITNCTLLYSALMSGIFKDHIRVPYSHYRNHENPVKSPIIESPLG